MIQGMMGSDYDRYPRDHARVRGRRALRHRANGAILTAIAMEFCVDPPAVSVGQLLGSAPNIEKLAT